jgi:hypothetical protein
LDTWLIREYVWAIYDGFLKANGARSEEEETPVEARPEFEVMVKAARRILKLSSEELPRTRAVFAICRVARQRGEWAMVMEFIQTLDPESLSDEAREQNGRTVPSDRQQWLSFITRACLELERYEECRRFAREGMERYAPVMFFPRWHALAQIRGGEAEAGLEELKAVERRFFAPWYVRREIAEACEQLGRDAEAWEWYSAAARSPGEMRNRAAMLAQMGHLLERLDAARWPWTTCCCPRPWGREKNGGRSWRSKAARRWRRSCSGMRPSSVYPPRRPQRRRSRPRCWIAAGRPGSRGRDPRAGAGECGRALSWIGSAHLPFPLYLRY